MKIQTKCLIFLRRKREIQPLLLNGDKLPFTDSAKHLGHYLDNSKAGIKKDMKMKRAMAVQKNNELCQEFYFCHPTTKLKLNQIYNFCYTGCQLWDLFCREAIYLENSFNVSVRIMLGLPVTTHRYLIQPLAGGVHVKQVFAQRFLKFCDKLKNSKKAVIKDTFNKIKLDVRTTTGKNLTELSELVNKQVGNLTHSDASELTYEAIEDEQKYRINFIKENVGYEIVFFFYFSLCNFTL